MDEMKGLNEQRDISSVRGGGDLVAESCPTL